MSNKPFLLKPVGKDYIWGGEKLKTEYNKKIDLNPLAETWECSTHPDGLSYVATGEYSGKTLMEVLKLHPEYLGKFANIKGELPILVKFIDANKDLSVQVHPTDEYALEHENGQLGKTEMWYVLESKPSSTIVYGFNKDMSREVVEEALTSGNIEEYLNKVEVKKGDSFLINAGTVHAIGSGIIVAEIQENSNLTYRIYDYSRIDKNGNKRELHISKALDVMNYNKMDNIEVCKSKYFDTHKEKIENESKIRIDENCFHVLLCIDGNGKLLFENEEIDFIKGDCIFVPANSVEINAYGNAEILNISC